MALAGAGAGGLGSGSFAWWSMVLAIIAPSSRPAASCTGALCGFVPGMCMRVWAAMPIVTALILLPCALLNEP